MSMKVLLAYSLAHEKTEYSFQGARYDGFTEVLKVYL